jgi:nicotinamide-nucleotide amidase
LSQQIEGLDRLEALDELSGSVAASAKGHGHRVVTAESLTAGKIAAALASGGDATEWFVGGLVAWSTPLKRSLLGVTVEDVYTPECADQMARGALAATDATLVVAVTGVGGPDPEGSHPPGEVHICVGGPESRRTFSHQFDGDAAQVVELATRAALGHLKGAALATRA